MTDHPDIFCFLLIESGCSRKCHSPAKNTNSWMLKKRCVYEKLSIDAVSKVNADVSRTPAKYFLFGGSVRQAAMPESSMMIIKPTSTAEPM